MSQTAAPGRRELRARLREQRAAIPAGERQAHDAAIAAGLEAVFARLGCRSLAVYWPLAGEPDLTPWYATWRAGGIELALPAVRERAAPLVFLNWHADAVLEPDLLGIPAPAGGAAVRPELLLAPFVGIDAAGYRLGNGGGYFDRTVAGMTDRPRLVGVGYAACEVESIAPEPHDIPMDAVVTEAGVRWPRNIC